MNQTRHYVVVTGGMTCTEQILEFSIETVIWIAVDSGAEILLENGIFPDILVGDLDSISNKTLQLIQKKGQTEIFQFPVEKDFSDTYLALKIVSLLEKGGIKKLFNKWKKYHKPSVKSSLIEKWHNINQLWGVQMQTPELCIDYKGSSAQAWVNILGAYGSRIDHSLANYWISFSFIKKFHIIFWQENNLIIPCEGKTKIYFKVNPKYPYFSILPVSNKVVGLCLKGFRYPLENFNIRQEKASLLLSNELIKESVVYKMKFGKVLIIRSGDFSK